MKRLDSHYIVTKLFNPAFNEFINRNLQRRVIGKDYGTETNLHSQGKFYYQAKDLALLRDRMLKSGHLTEGELKAMIEQMKKIHASTGSDETFRKGMDAFIFSIDQELGAVRPSAKPAEKKAPEARQARKTPKVEAPQYMPFCPQCQSSFDVKKIEENLYNCEGCKKAFDSEGNIVKRPVFKAPAIRMPQLKVPAILKQPLPSPKKPMPNWLYYFSAAWVGVLLIGIFIFTVLTSTVETQVVETYNRSRVLEFSEQETVSFESIMNETSGNVTVKAYLRRYVEGEANTGVYTYALEDGSGNRIIISSALADYEGLFPRNGITEKAYDVSGTLRKRYNGLNIAVTGIKEVQPLSPRAVNETYTETQTRTVLAPKYPKARALIAGMFS